jgi:glycosyltransferase involved in cell wall biosynthesis
MPDKPLVSIIMSVYRVDAKFLEDSVQSILDQTYKYFEFIVIIDGAEKYITELLQAYSDKRIKLFSNNTNIGLTKSLNLALQKCKGKYIARMDADDVSLPSRIEKQVECFEANSFVNVLGCNVEYFGNIKGTSCYKHPKDRETQQINLFFANNGLAHISVMIRKSFFDKHHINYNERYIKAQDYGLWTICTVYSKLYCLEDVLVKYRIHKDQISCKTYDEQKKYENYVKIDQLNKLRILPSSNEVRLHLNFCDNYKLKVSDLRDLKTWISKLIVSNNNVDFFSKNKFSETLMTRFFFCSYGIYKNNKSLIALFNCFLVLTPSFLFKKMYNFVWGKSKRHQEIL